MVFVLVFVIFLTVFIMLYGILSILSVNTIDIKRRIEQIKNFQGVEQENIQNQTFIERILKPVYKSFSRFILKLTPGHKLALLNKRLERAGMLKNSTAERWLFTKSMMVIIFSIMMCLLSYTIEPNPLKAIVIALLVAVCVNTFLNFYISRKIEGRKKMILKSLPYSLDLITVSVEAGLSFDGAMARVIGNISGELCDEFAKCLKEIRMGIERKVALKSLSERCNVKELTMFITSLIQADDLGVSLGRVLRIEASNLREHRKQVAREKAMKAPIKMLFPLIFFIFPSIFIIILGPVVIKMMNVFMR